MRKSTVFILFLLLPAVAAFNVDFETVSNNINKNETAKFNMRITNTNGFNDSFSVSTRNPSFVIDTEPSVGTIPPFTTKSYTLLITPKQGTDVGPVAAPVKVESGETSKFVTENLLLNIRSGTPYGGEYAPVIDLSVTVPDIVDPRNNVPVNIKMKNKNPRDMPDLTLNLRSSLENRSFSIDMPPLGSREKQVLLQTPRSQRPGIYEVAVELIEANVTVSEVTKEFEVKGYKDVQRDVQTDSTFFTITNTYVFTNRGNVQSTITERVPVAWYNYLFTSFDKPRPRNTWRETLKPGESFRFSVTYDYRSLVFAILLILFGIGGYYMFRSPVVITKTAVVDVDEEMKVRLEVKNRGRESAENVVVLDKIPNMADFVKKEQPGTLSPDKVVTSESKGTSLTWNLDRLEPGEERIIQYTITSKLQVVGGLKLPPSKVKFHYEDKQRSSLSNSATVVE